MIKNSFLSDVYDIDSLAIPAIGKGVSQLKGVDLGLSGRNPAEVSSVLELRPYTEDMITPEIAKTVDYGQTNATANDAAVEDTGKEAAETTNATQKLQGWLGTINNIAAGFKPDTKLGSWGPAQLRAPSMILGR